MDYYILIVIGIILLTFDSIYLFLLKDIFIKQIISVQKTNFKINIVPAALCYLLLVLGLYYFIIKQRKSVMDAALLGFVIYGVYEFTNKSIIKDWTYFTAVLDVTWGTILFGLTTYLYNRLNKIL